MLRNLICHVFRKVRWWFNGRKPQPSGIIRNEEWRYSHMTQGLPETVGLQSEMHIFDYPQLQRSHRNPPEAEPIAIFHALPPYGVVVEKDLPIAHFNHYRGECIKSGRAQWFRLYATDKTRWMDGSIAQFPPGDLLLDSTYLCKGRTTVIDRFILTF